MQASSSVSLSIGARPSISHRPSKGGSFDSLQRVSTSYSSEQLHHGQSKDHSVRSAEESHLSSDESWDQVLLVPLERVSSTTSTLIDSPGIRSASLPADEAEKVGSDGQWNEEKPAEDGGPLYISRSESRYLPPWFLLGPAVAVLLLTAGLATIMLVWIQSHKLPLESEGVIFVREGIEDEPDRLYTDPTLGSNNTLRFNTQIAHSTGLSFSTIISTLVGLSVYPLMSLIAYSLATDWLILQSKVAESPSVAHREKLPTPMQYALLLQLCSSQSIEAVWNTLRHVLLNKGSRASVPGLLKKALAWLIVLLALNTAIAWTDFWLHESVKIVQVVHVDTGSSMRNYGMQLNTTLCPNLQGAESLPCLVAVDVATGELDFAPQTNLTVAEVRSHGTLAFRGMSDIYAMADLGELEQTSRPERFRNRFSSPEAAVDEALVFVTSPEVSAAQIFSTPTVGVESQCELITSACQSNQSAFDCANVGHPEIRSSGMGRTSSSRSSGLLQLLLVRTVSPLGVGSSAAEPVNPIQVDVVVNLPVANTTKLDRTGFKTLEQEGISSVYGIATCNMSYYDLQLDYFNGTFSSHNERTLASPELAYQLSGPIMAGSITRPLVASLASAAARLNSSNFVAELGYALSYSGLSMASGLLAPVPVSVKHAEEILASQYPVVPLYFYFGLLYSYALVAVILFFWAWSSSSDSVTYDCPTTGQRVQVPAATLAQRVLMDPGRLIAIHLGRSQKHGHGSTPASITTMLAHATGGLDPTKWTTRGADRAASEGDGDTGVQRVAVNRQAVFRTTAKDLLDLFDEPVHQERLVVGLEGRGLGFGVWPLSQAMGAVGQSGRRNKRESLVRAGNIFHHPHHSPNEDERGRQHPYHGQHHYPPRPDEPHPHQSGNGYQYDLQNASLPSSPSSSR